jgi:hypothetical protein
MLVRAALIGVLVLLAACSSTVRSGAAIQPDPVYRETEVRHARPRLNGELFDPSESDPALASAFASADQKAERLVGNTKRDSQFITKFWSEKKRILKAEFGVTWRTPAEMNPQIRYANYGQPMLTDEERSALESLRKLPRPANSVMLDSPAENGRGDEEVEIHGIADRGDPEGRRGRPIAGRDLS